MQKPASQTLRHRPPSPARFQALRIHLPWAAVAVVLALLAAGQTALGILVGALTVVMLPLVYAHDASEDR